MSSPINENIKNCVKYIINNTSEALPIKKSEIIQFALNGDLKKFNPDFVKQLKESLKQIYGLKLCEVPASKPTTYIVVSEYFGTSIHSINLEQESEINLLFIILTQIFLNSTAIFEKALFEFLQKVDIDVDKPHPYFGKSLRKKISETFVKQLYLKREKRLEENDFAYEWGYRSTVEFSRDEILSFVSKCTGRPKSSFVELCNEIQSSGCAEKNEVEVTQSSSQNTMRMTRSQKYQR